MGPRFSNGRQALAALLLALAALPTAPAKAGAPYLWRIEAPDAAPSWIFGTIHLQRPDVATPPAPVLRALDRADAVLTEIPMDPGTLLALAPKMLLRSGQSLDAILGPRTTADLEKEFRSIDPSLDLASLSRLRPWVLAATLIGVEDQTKHPHTVALDQFLFQRGTNAGKETGGLERPEEQLAIFADLTDSEQAAMVRDTIAQVRSIRAIGQSPSDLLAGLYLAGDLDALAAKLIEIDVGGEDPALTAKLTDRLLHQRNATMGERMIKKLRDNPRKSFFFATGAAHLPGQRGLLSALEKAGFKLTRVE